MITRVVVKLEFEGIHAWPACPIPAVSFLKHPHRHVFHITAKKRVRHDDRETEIIMLKRQMLAHLHDRFPTRDFHSRSCEMIAKHLVKQFELDYCEVLEDGENGAEVMM